MNHNGEPSVPEPHPDAVPSERLASESGVESSDPLEGLGGEDPEVLSFGKSRRARNDRPPIRWPLLVAVAVGSAALVLVVQQIGGNSTGTPSSTSTSVAMTATASPTLDQAKVQALKSKIDADPKDVVSMRALGDLYSLSGDSKSAGTWHAKALVLEPNNVDTLLSYGVDEYNEGALDQAKIQWLKVTQIDPRQADAWYNLGFLYLAQDPPDLDGVRKSWEKVIEVAPDSDMATNVRNHLGQLASTPSATPSATPSPTPSR
jgi:tetratricopeptide (TPR) repeat protein